MKHGQLVFLLVFFRIGISNACPPNYFLQPPPLDSVDLVHVAAMSSGAVNLDLLKIILHDTRECENIMISPVGVSLSMAMVSLASSGQTKAEIDKIFQFDILNNIAPYLANHIYKKVNDFDFRNSFDTARSFFGDVSLLLQPDFQQELVEWFDEPFRKIAFKSGLAERQINSWVAGSTEGKIKETIPDGALGSDIFILVNAIASRAIWLNEFNASQTKSEPFYLNRHQLKDVDMMDNYKSPYSNFFFYHDEELKFKVIDIPYSVDHLTMVILLPDEIDTLRSIIYMLTMPKLLEVYYKMTIQSVRVKLPKFTLETENCFKDPLIKLGVLDVFCESSDIQGVCSPYEPIKLNQIKHEAYLQVNEQGVPGKAANALPPQPSTPVIYPNEFVVDHPFAVLVLDTVTGFIALAGTVFDP